MDSDGEDYQNVAPVSSRIDALKRNSNQPPAFQKPNASNQSAPKVPQKGLPYSVPDKSGVTFKPKTRKKPNCLPVKPAKSNSNNTSKPFQFFDVKPLDPASKQKTGLRSETSQTEGTKFGRAVNRKPSPVNLKPSTYNSPLSNVLSSEHLKKPSSPSPFCPHKVVRPNIVSKTDRLNSQEEREDKTEISVLLAKTMFERKEQANTQHSRTPLKPVGKLNINPFKKNSINQNNSRRMLHNCGAIDERVTLPQKDNQKESDGDYENEDLENSDDIYDKPDMEQPLSPSVFLERLGTLKQKANNKSHHTDSLTVYNSSEDDLSLYNNFDDENSLLPDLPPPPDHLLDESPSNDYNFMTGEEEEEEEEEEMSDYAALENTEKSQFYQDIKKNDNDPWKSVNAIGKFWEQKQRHQQQHLEDHRRNQLEEQQNQQLKLEKKRQQEEQQRRQQEELQRRQQEEQQRRQQEEIQRRQEEVLQRRQKEELQRRQQEEHQRRQRKILELQRQMEELQREESLQRMDGSDYFPSQSTNDSTQHNASNQHTSKNRTTSSSMSSKPALLPPRGSNHQNQLLRENNNKHAPIPQRNMKKKYSKLPSQNSALPARQKSPDSMDARKIKFSSDCSEYPHQNFDDTKDSPEQLFSKGVRLHPVNANRHSFQATDNENAYETSNEQNIPATIGWQQQQQEEDGKTYEVAPRLPQPSTTLRNEDRLALIQSSIQHSSSVPPRRSHVPLPPLPDEPKPRASSLPPESSSNSLSSIVPTKIKRLLSETIGSHFPKSSGKNSIISEEESSPYSFINERSKNKKNYDQISSNAEQPLNSHLHNFLWYKGSISRQEAEQYLSQEGKEGSFIVKKSSKDDGYALYTYTGGEIKHLRINHSEAEYYIGTYTTQRFSCIEKLIKHYQSAQFHLSSGATVLLAS